MRSSYLVVAVSLILAGCSAIPKTKSMVPTVTANDQPRFHACLTMGEVRGGSSEEGIGPARFVSALQQALQKANLFDAAAPQDKGYRLNVLIMGQEQPGFGLNFTVRLGVRYTLIKVAGEEEVWNKEIFSEHTETCCGSPIGVVRVRKASEGAARNNIRMAIEELGNLTLD